jgi:ELWxxDGT repeat protein
LYFLADEGNKGIELWVTDGTTVGTQLLKNINPTGDSYSRYFTEYNEKLYFQADDGTNGYELWITDGTSAGTQMTMPPIAPNLDPLINTYIFAVYDSSLYFSANYNSIGKELWKLTDTTYSASVNNIEKTINNINIFPNPAKEKIYITSYNDKITYIEITNIIGQIVKAQNFVSLQDKSVALDISSYRKGVYFVKIITDNSTVIKKLLIE